jgi:hypothetical protein
MLYLKIIDRENTFFGSSSDESAETPFKIVSIADDETVKFSSVYDTVKQRDIQCALVHKKGDGFVTEYELTGNAYLMNSQGKTIARHNLVSQPPAG